MDTFNRTGWKVEEFLNSQSNNRPPYLTDQLTACFDFESLSGLSAD